MIRKSGHRFSRQIMLKTKDRFPCCHVAERDNRGPRSESRTGLMADAKYDVLGIGNAIFDVLVRTDEKFLADHGMTKGGMALIDEARAASIYRDMGPATEISGGSAANTIVGVANLGARAAYVGKVKDDQIGKLYSHDIRAAGVAFETRPASDGPATGCSYILVTPDG